MGTLDDTPFSNPVRGTLKPATMAGFPFQNGFRTENRTDYRTKRNLHMAGLLPYKLAELCNTAPADWFVYYYFLDPSTGKYKRFKERHGLNNFRQLQMISAKFNKSVDECRQLMADEMIKFINNELRTGFNPFRQAGIVLSESNDHLLDVLQKVVDDLCTGATQSARETYRLMLSRFRKFLLLHKMDHWPPAHFDQDHAEQFQSWLKDDQHLAKKTVNATTAHLGKFWDLLRKKVKSNPFRQLRAVTDADYRGKAIDTDDVFEPLTSAELDLILQELKDQDNHGFIVYLAFIYYAWMRPVEITRLKVSDIDLAGGVIRTRKSETKNKKGGMVQIVPQLMKLIKKMHLDKVKRMDHFLFSKGFKPGPTQLDASRGVGYYHWNPIVQKLGINKKMYALKHSGNIEYLMQNKGKADLKWQQMQNRHSSAAMTEKYNRKLGAYLIDVGRIKFRSF